jgi:pimeloyl-ACP methyl ester carboxylesterase
MVILNGGPGRSNLRLSFELDSILKYYNVLLPGYRGIDDKIFDGFNKVSADSLKLFIANHKSLFGSGSISSDIKLIAEHLKIESLTLLGHSFGTLVSAEFATIYPSLVDTIFAFSPESFNKPYPSAKKLRGIVDSMSIKLGYSPNAITTKLSALGEGSQSESFYMGVISSFYTRNDIINFLTELNTNKLSKKTIEEKGKRFMQQEWLFDFGLKFCKIDSITSPINDIYDEIAKGFRIIISRYVTDEGCTEIDVDYDNLPVQVYIPKFDFFYYSSDSAVYDACMCAHADLWRKAPGIILRSSKSGD